MRAPFVLFLLMFGLGLKAQSESNIWKTLSKVEIQTKFDESLQFDVEFPIFSEDVKALDDKEITIEGFIVPLEELQGEKYFVLSLFPFSNCFFCGGAGPETVIEVFSKKEIDFTEKKIKVRGKLTINPDDPMRLMYILKEATLVD